MYGVPVVLIAVTEQNKDEKDSLFVQQQQQNSQKTYYVQ
jgi:hypothetical protein